MFRGLQSPSPSPSPSLVHLWLHKKRISLILQVSGWCLNPKKTGGGGPKRPPLDILRDYSATRKALAATFYDFFLSSFPHILTTNLWCPGVRFWSYVTLCTCTSDRKWLQNVILCTKSMQIEFFLHSSYKYAYFYSQWLKWISFSIIVLQKVSATNFTEKSNKNKRSK